MALVRSIASGNHAALHSLFARAQRPVFTFLVRATDSQDVAEELTLDVFEDIWRHASLYDPAERTVLCWIMNRARSRAIDPMRGGHRRARHSPPMVTANPKEDVLQPLTNLQQRLFQRIASESDEGATVLTQYEPEWEEVGPGIFCQLLANDSDRHRVSMLVRLLPGIMYPPHTHAGREELHLLHGELWIEDRKLIAGDYHLAEANTQDRRVWSATGCTCVLHTSTLDRLA